MRNFPVNLGRRRGKMSSSSIQKKRNIVLHFDLNRTILMSDAAGGRSMENTVNYLLSECTWGYISPENPQKVCEIYYFLSTINMLFVVDLCFRRIKY
jgi:hypothetical protein